MRSILKTASLALCFWMGADCSAAELKDHHPNLGEVRVVPATPTPEPEFIQMAIAFPQENEVKTQQPIGVQLRLEGYPLGVNSDFPREREVFNDPEGQSLHIFIDDRPYFVENTAFISSLDDSENYYQQTLDFSIPYHLQPGMHVMRIFPVRSYNESIKKCTGCFRAHVFYVHTKQKNLNVDLNEPYLTYNEPQGDYKFNPTKPILLDFYITNCQLSKDGYKVRLSIDGTTQRVINQWVPFYVYGLKKGSHVFRLQLMDPQNNLVPGIFNDVERTIFIR